MRQSVPGTGHKAQAHRDNFLACAGDATVDTWHLPVVSINRGEDRILWRSVWDWLHGETVEPGSTKW